MQQITDIVVINYNPIMVTDYGFNVLIKNYRFFFPFGFYSCLLTLYYQRLQRIECLSQYAHYHTIVANPRVPYNINYQLSVDLKGQLRLK